MQFDSGAYFPRYTSTIYPIAVRTKKDRPIGAAILMNPPVAGSEMPKMVLKASLQNSQNLNKQRVARETAIPRKRRHFRPFCISVSASAVA